MDKILEVILIVSLIVQSVFIFGIVVVWLQLRSIVALIKTHSELMTKLSTGIAFALASGARIEAAAAVVADDLSEAHKRADAVNITAHGAAADAASRQTEKEKRNGTTT